MTLDDMMEELEAQNIVASVDNKGEYVGDEEFGPEEDLSTAVELLEQCQDQLAKLLKRTRAKAKKVSHLQFLEIEDLSMEVEAFLQMFNVENVEE
jgi:hypothetical protein